MQLEPTKAVTEPVPQAPAPAPVPNVVMAGAVEIGATYKVTLAITAQSPGPNFLMLGITEARLLAKSLTEWAQYAEDRNNGKAQ